MKKVKIYPRTKSGKHWQVNIDPQHRHLADTYAFLANNNTIRPQFNEDEYRYNLGPVGDRYSDEKINELVRKLAFNDPFTGAKITKADPTNRLDPFFCNPKCKAKVGRDVQTLDLNKPNEELVYAIMSADPLCVIGASSISKHPNAEWVIEDEVVDAEARESKRERSIKINKRFESLSISQKKDLLTALGVRLTGLEKDVIIEDLLYLKITENKSSDELLSIQDTFLELTNKESKGKLELTVKVEKMFQYAILRKENTSVYFNGEKLSTDVFNIVQFLSEPANSGIFLSLEEALTAKMKTA